VAMTSRTLIPYDVMKIWKFGYLFDNGIDQSFILLPDWCSSRQAIDKALYRLRERYLVDLMKRTSVDRINRPTLVESVFDEDDKLRQLDEISNIEMECDVIEINQPNYASHVKTSEIAERELPRVRKLLDIIKRIIR
ncbi:hypothetical protein PENTCL1PPCAC_17028, partial [Pristionchus entomophagus]